MDLRLLLEVAEKLKPPAQPSAETEARIIPHKKIQNCGIDTQADRKQKFRCLFNGCNFAGASESSILRHQTKHTGIRAFRCDVCALTFTRKDNLDQHRKRKHIKPIP